MGKSRAVIGWESVDKRASFVYNLKVENEFCLSAEGGARSFDKSGIFEKNTIRNLLKSILSKLLTLPSADKKNSFSI